MKPFNKILISLLLSFNTLNAQNTDSTLNTGTNFDMSIINSSTTISETSQRITTDCVFSAENFEEYTEKKDYQLFTLAISNNAKTAIVVQGSAGWTRNYYKDGKASLIDLTDGNCLFKFDFKEINGNVIYNSDDTKLFYFDDNYVKELDLTTYEIKNLFKVDFDRGFQYLNRDPNLFIESDFLHFSFIDEFNDKPHDYNERIIKVFDYSYNLITGNSDMNFFDFDNYFGGFAHDIRDYYNKIEGFNKDKLLKMKLIFGADLVTKSWGKPSENKLLIIKFPEVYVLKNGQFIYANSISLFETDKNTNESRSLQFSDDDSHMVQITDSNRLVFLSRKDEDAEIFVLELGNDLFPKVKHPNPYRIKRENAAEYTFVHFFEKTKSVYYERISTGGGHDIFINNYNSTSSTGVLSKSIDFKVKNIDKILNDYYIKYINLNTIKNQPLESNSERDFRINGLQKKIFKPFIQLQDSLFENLNKFINDSILDFKYNSAALFNPLNYNQLTECWHITIDNPFKGKSFSLSYHQPRLIAKEYLQDNFSNIEVTVKYYFNLISLNYEPIILYIKNKEKNIVEEFIIPYNDVSLYKNLFLSGNTISPIDIEGFLGRELNDNTLTIDDRILRFFCLNGRNKLYYQYKGNYDNGFEWEREWMYDLDDILYKEKPHKDILGDVMVGPYMLKRPIYSENLSYFADQLHNNSMNGYTVNENIEVKRDRYYKNYVDHSSIEIIDSLKSIIKSFDISKLGSQKPTLEYEQQGIVLRDWEYAFSPNGNFLVIRYFNKTYLYKTTNWNVIANFNNTTGTIYWDCNSNYFGVGNNVFPVRIIENLLK
jgi:hypothetical protein